MTVSSTTWKDLKMTGKPDDPNGTGESGADPLVVIAKGPVSLTFSGTFSGGPVQVRAVDNGQVLRPGPARFDPVAGDSSRSFSFVGPGRATATCRYIVINWRAMDPARSVTLKRGDFILTYNGERGACD
jgi:hypothetical protein